jgi:hypothetical protein
LGTLKVPAVSRTTLQFFTKPLLCIMIGNHAQE